MNKDMIVIPTTELSEDPETAIELGMSWGVKNFEFKSLWQNRVPAQTDAQKKKLLSVIKDYGVNVVAFSPGYGLGVPATEESARKEVDEKLLRTFDMANAFNCKRVVVFGFNKTEGVSNAFYIEKMGQAAQLAKRDGFELVIEPIQRNHIDNGQAAVRVIKAVGLDSLRLNWDPGNIQMAGYRAYPDEYNACKSYITHCHLKDVVAAAKEWRLFGDGDIPLKANLEQMKRDGYTGYLSVETHTRYNRNGHRLMPVASTRYNVQLLQRWLAELDAPVFQPWEEANNIYLKRG